MENTPYSEGGNEKENDSTDNFDNEFDSSEGEKEPILDAETGAWSCQVFIEGESDQLLDTSKKKKRKYNKRKRDSIDSNPPKKKHKSRKSSIDENSNDNCSDNLTDNVSATADEHNVNENTSSDAGSSSSANQLHTVTSLPLISNENNRNIPSTNSSQANLNLQENSAISKPPSNTEQDRSLPEKSTNLNEESNSNNVQGSASNASPVASVKKEKGLQPDSDVILNMLEIVDQPPSTTEMNPCINRSQPLSKIPSTSETVLQQEQSYVPSGSIPIELSNDTILPMGQIIAATGGRISENEVLISIPEVGTQDDLAETITNDVMVNRANIGLLSQNSATTIENPKEIPIIPPENTDTNASIAEENDSFEEPVSPPHFTLADYKLDPGMILKLKSK